ncbi:BQ2448_3466 [Microbotryum intermedium]|uniref:BQ2448_3466 protein n=1 Tax=Microbotryum intermedium TaxID=269621 RepID=A0A238FFQ0_9BASI|nr:BQ2448_3466 [Microbotryum intermedium]
MDVTTPTVEFRFTNPHKPAVVRGDGNAGGGSSAASATAANLPSGFESGRAQLTPSSAIHGWRSSDRFKHDSFINQFRLGASGGVIGSAAIATPLNTTHSSLRARIAPQGTGGIDSKASPRSSASTKANTPLASMTYSSTSSPNSTRMANRIPSLPLPIDDRDVTARSEIPLAPTNVQSPPIAPPSVPEIKQQSENKSSPKLAFAPSKPKKQLADDRASPRGGVEGQAPSHSGTSGTDSQKPGASHRGLERSKEEPKAKRIKTSGGTGCGVAAEGGRAARSTTAQDNPLVMQVGVMQRMSMEMINENVNFKRRLELAERRIRELEGEKQELKDTFRAKVEDALQKYVGAGLELAQTQKNLQETAERLDREVDVRELVQLRKEIQESLGGLQRDYTNPEGKLTLERLESSKLDVLRQQQQELKNRDDVISLLREKLEMNTGLLAEANVQRSALETQVGKVEGQVAHLQRVVEEQMRQSEADRTKHRQETQERDSAIAAAASEKGTLMKEFEALKTQHEALTLQKEEIDQVLVDKEGQLKRLTSDLKTEQEELERLRGLHDGQESELETLRPLREEVQQAKAELVRHTSQSDQMIDFLRADLSKLEQQLGSKVDELQIQADTNAEHVERISALEGTVAKLEATNQTAALQAVDLNNTLEASHQQIVALQTDLQRQRDANLSDRLELTASHENEVKLEHELGQVKKARDEASERCATLVKRQEERERQKVDEVMASMERELAKKDADLATKERELKRAQNRIGVEERAKQKALLQIAKLKQRPVIENDIGSSPNGSAVRKREGRGEEGAEIGKHDESPTPSAMDPPAAVPVRAQQRAKRATPASTTSKRSMAGTSSGGNRS